MKSLFKLILKLAAFLVLAFAFFIIVIIATNYHPKDQETLTIVTGSDLNPVRLEQEYSIMTWNTGYGALGEQQDFFMDGGFNSGAFSKEEVVNNTQAIKQFIQTKDPDFILLQEVDKSGKRSKDVNQVELYQSAEYYSNFATNYQNLFVPVPITNPMGQVHSGIMTLSKAPMISADRFTLQGKESFFIQLFELNRCFSVTRYPVNDKELVIINTHFSAFDQGGKIRAQQLSQMRTYLETEAQKGNYVILGGDFNHELPGTSSANFTWTVPLPTWVQIFPADFKLDNYSWAVDHTTPTVRSNEQPYVAGENFIAVIDGFLVSNNIEIVKVQGHQLNFEHTDHNPVSLTFKLH